MPKLDNFLEKAIRNTRSFIEAIVNLLFFALVSLAAVSSTILLIRTYPEYSYMISGISYLTSSIFTVLIISAVVLLLLYTTFLIKNYVNKLKGGNN